MGNNINPGTTYDLIQHAYMHLYTFMYVCKSNEGILVGFYLTFFSHFLLVLFKTGTFPLTLSHEIQFGRESRAVRTSIALGNCFFSPITFKKVV